MQPPTTACPLCRASPAEFYHRDAQRDFLQCPQCALVFVPAAFFLSREEERRHYDFHENDPDDMRYRNFLNRLCAPLLERLPPGSCGLDFGCGPGPTLSKMLEEAGHQVALYDPAYAPDHSLLEQSYDFITATEVFEHLHDPHQELQRLWSLLRPGGWLGVMTKRVESRDRFATWHYRTDPTHVIFFSAETFHWLAARWQAELFLPAADVALFHKAAVDTGCSAHF